MLGAKDVAFPRLNLGSFYLWVTGAVFFLNALLSDRSGHGLDVLHALQTTTEAQGAVVFATMASLFWVSARSSPFLNSS